MSSLSNKCARQSQISRNVASGHYLRKAIRNLDGKFTTKGGEVRDVFTRPLSAEERKEKAEQEWNQFFRG